MKQIKAKSLVWT